MLPATDNRRQTRIETSGFHANDPLGLDTGPAATRGKWKSRVLTLGSSQTPPDPTRPAQANIYAMNSLLNASDSIRITLELNPGGVFTVTSPDIPGLVTEGRTSDEISANIQEALDALRLAWRALGKELPSALPAKGLDCLRP